MNQPTRIGPGGTFQQQPGLYSGADREGLERLHGHLHVGACHVPVPLRGAGCCTQG